MIFRGKVLPPKKGERHWLVKVPDLGVFTQGKSEKDAYEMAADAIETIVDRKGFRVEVLALGNGQFLISANDPTPLVARWIHRLRIKRGFSVREAARKLGSTSPEAWARYESGRASPTIEKLAQLLHVVDPEGKFALQRVMAPALKKAS